MSVLLADGRTYQVRRKTTTKDASLFPVTSYPDAADWTGEGYREQRPDRTWAVTLDVESWPLAYDDEVTFPDGTKMLVRTAVLVPDDPDPIWDAVRGVNITGELRALEQLPREEQGGQPG